MGLRAVFRAWCESQNCLVECRSIVQLSENLGAPFENAFCFCGALKDETQKSAESQGQRTFPLAVGFVHA